MMSFRARQPFDRFINGRSRSDGVKFNLEDANVDSLSDIELEDEKDGYLQPTFINTAKKAKNILCYRRKILEALQIKPFKVLKGLNLNKKENSTDFFNEIPPWPVKTRRKPLLRTPETVLDMPGIDGVDAILYRHVIDWGKQGQIATIFHGEVHLWSCVQGQLSHTKTNKTISNCVKWNRSGTRFAVARIESEISIIDGESLKVLRTVRCKCISCTTTSIQWSKDDRVISGCSNGSLTILSDADALVQHFYKWLDGEIVDLKFSCNDKYLLVTSLKGNSSIFLWPMIWNSQQKMIFSERDENQMSIKSAAWHPWKESTLVVGEMDNVVVVWNVNNRKPIDHNIVEPYFKKSTTCILDYVTFNPLSAELLVSFYHENPDPSSNNGCNFLTVFSDLNTRVDEVRYHIGRVHHVLWDGTGTKLATVGTDENLVLWNFFGTESDTEGTFYSKQRRGFKGIFDAACQFGSCIR